MNKVILLGYVGRDPRVYETGERSRAVFSLATHETVKREGIKEQRTLWHEVVVFNPYLLPFVKELKKGDQVLVEGRLRYHVIPQEPKPLKIPEIVVSEREGKLFVIRTKEARETALASIDSSTKEETELCQQKTEQSMC